MRTRNFLYLLCAGGVITAVLFSCGKFSGVEGRTSGIAALKPAKLDSNAGTWKPVLLAGPTDISVPAPDPVSSPLYIADLNEIKSLQQSLTKADQANIAYWGAGGVLRWNEILRELVSKYNLPPQENADNTYPAPSPTNPFAYPQFPFANPPYASRAYAYISAAQYDALVTAWYYKNQYNRPAPYKNDATVKALLPQSDLPAYPSEAAVLAGVTAEMMKLLFPTEIANVQAKLEMEERAAMQAGMAARSDIMAGEAIGRQVAEKFIARARTDKAGAAIGTPADWAGFETTTQARGEIPWYSLDIPKRPPMLPLFGRVTPFLFDASITPTLRPGPPPSTSSDQMKKETQEVYSYVKEPSRENVRITQFWADGVGTSTPSGHWDEIASEDFIKKNLSEVRWARNMALVNMALMDAAIVCWDTKYYYFNPRPSQMNPAIKTTTGIPNFPSYISGHSTFSGAASTILGYLVPERANDYSAMATEASLSRLVGGIHYRTDCQVGLTTGQKVGNYAIARAKTDGAD